MIIQMELKDDSFPPGSIQFAVPVSYICTGCPIFSISSIWQRQDIKFSIRRISKAGYPYTARNAVSGRTSNSLSRF